MWIDNHFLATLGVVRFKPLFDIDSANYVFQSHGFEPESNWLKIIHKFVALTSPASQLEEETQEELEVVRPMVKGFSIGYSNHTNCALDPQIQEIMEQLHLFGVIEEYSFVGPDHSSYTTNS